MVEVVLTDGQAGLLAAAADITLRSNAADDGLVTLEEDEATEIERLAVFMTTVAANPQHFPVTGRMARTIKKRTLASRLPKIGAGDTGRSVRNGRKARQERRARFHKDRRKHRRETAEAYNTARTKMEAEVAEMQAIQAERQAEIENEPKFDVTDIMGNVVISDVPYSMIVPKPDPASLDEDGLPAVHDDPSWSLESAERFHGKPKPKVILPGSAEALGVELDN